MVKLTKANFTTSLSPSLRNECSQKLWEICKVGFMLVFWDAVSAIEENTAFALDVRQKVMFFSSSYHSKPAGIDCEFNKLLSRQTGCLLKTFDKVALMAGVSLESWAQNVTTIGNEMFGQVALSWEDLHQARQTGKSFAAHCKGRVFTKHLTFFSIPFASYIIYPLQLLYLWMKTCEGSRAFPDFDLQALAKPSFLASARKSFHKLASVKIGPLDQKAVRVWSCGFPVCGSDWNLDLLNPLERIERIQLAWCCFASMDSLSLNQAWISWRSPTCVCVLPSDNELFGQPSWLGRLLFLEPPTSLCFW